MALCSGDEDQAQERIHKLAKILKEKEVGSSLRTAGVGVISCIIQRDEGRTPMRHSFHWSTEKLHYEEEPLLRHLEPPLSIYLELVRSYLIQTLIINFYFILLLFWTTNFSRGHAIDEFELNFILGPYWEL